MAFRQAARAPVPPSAHSIGTRLKAGLHWFILPVPDPSRPSHEPAAHLRVFAQVDQGQSVEVLCVG